MADYTLTAGYAVTGNGTNITPERWITALQDALPTYSTWSQFLTTVVGGERLLEAGKISPEQAADLLSALDGN